MGEYIKNTGNLMPAQFEIDMPTEERRKILKEVFSGWTVLKSTIREQQYDIPREWGVSNLKTNVVTFVGRK